MPAFNVSRKNCNVTKIEALDEKENLIEDLEVSLGEMKIKPKQKFLIKEYKFALKVTMNGGGIIITNTKTLRFGNRFIKDGWYVYNLSEYNQVQKVSFSNEKEAQEYYNELGNNFKMLYHSGEVIIQNGNEEEI